MMIFFFFLGDDSLFLGENTEMTSVNIMTPNKKKKKKTYRWKELFSFVLSCIRRNTKDVEETPLGRRRRLDWYTSTWCRVYIEHASRPALLIIPPQMKS